MVLSREWEMCVAVAELRAGGVGGARMRIQDQGRGAAERDEAALLRARATAADL